MKFKGLTIIGIICIGIILWINFVDFKFEEIKQIEGKGQKFEYLIEGLCLSYVSGYMFWLLNVFWVEKREKKFILPLIAQYVRGIVANNHSIIHCLKKDWNLSSDYFPDKDEFKILLEDVNPKDRAPFYYQKENWIYLFRNRQRSTVDSIDKLLLSGRHLDDHLRSILLHIRDSLYLKEDYAFNSDEFNEVNLVRYQTVFIKYFELIKSLKDYYNKNLKPHFRLT